MSDNTQGDAAIAHKARRLVEAVFSLKKDAPLPGWILNSTHTIYSYRAGLALYDLVFTIHATENAESAE